MDDFDFSNYTTMIYNDISIEKGILSYARDIDADLIAYRLRHDRLVERDIATTFTSRFGGDFRLQVYTNVLDGIEHVALVKGDIGPDRPVSPTRPIWHSERTEPLAWSAER